MLVATTPRMSLRNAVPQNVQATIIVVISTGLAIFGAHHFERSGPDRELLRQLRVMHEARRERGAEGVFPRPVYEYAPRAASPERYAER